VTIRNVASIIREHGRDRPEESAVVFQGRYITYGDLDRRSNRFARALLSEGVGAQDRLAFLDKNSPEFFEAVFGTAKVNAVLCPVNWRLSPSEAAHVINDSEATVLVVGEELVPTVEELESALTKVEKIIVIGDHSHYQTYESWLSVPDTSDPGHESATDDVCFQFYSSGTTGRPKGVMLTNDNLFFSFESSNLTFGFGPRSTNLVVMPLFHVGGGAWALLGLFNGVPNVLLREVDPAEIISLITVHGITHAVLVPVVIQLMLADPSISDADLSSLKLIVYGASPISESVLVNAIETFGCDFIQAYGMTETTGGCVVLLPEDHDPKGPNSHRLQSAGKAGPGTEIRVVDTADLRDIPPGGVGEILIRSRRNTKGYWNMPDATAEAILSGGWLRTGDAGSLDEDGYLYIHDRVKDMVITGGENVYPAEVENALMSHEGIADVAIVGVPDERWGETPKAFVVRADQEVTEPDIIAYARGQLAHYKCPTSVEFVDALPRNASGKVLKKELRAPYWQDRTRGVN
jgi:long-chain acyl-CoA synthetase